MTPSAASPASIAARASSSASGAVTRLASMVVVPFRRWNSAARLASSAVPSVNDVPPPPCTCMSTNPGSTQPSAQVGDGKPGRLRGRLARADRVDTAPGQPDPAGAQHAVRRDHVAGGQHT